MGREERRGWSRRKARPCKEEKEEEEEEEKEEMNVSWTA